MALVAQCCCKPLKLRRNIDINTGNRDSEDMVAEEVGFEPTVGVNPRRFSRPVHSTTLPLLRHSTNYRKIFDS